jgi:hypothetical protein
MNAKINIVNISDESEFTKGRSRQLLLSGSNM